MGVVTPVTLRHLVAGRWADGRGEELRSVNPSFPDITVAEGFSATNEQLDIGIAAASEALKSWIATPIQQRGTVLLDAAKILDSHAETWGLDLATEEGKTRAEAVAEVHRAAQILRYYGTAGDRQTGEVYASPRAGEHILVTRKPVGIVAVVTPFNFPIAIPTWKIAPALVYGNAVVWKPASTVPLLSMHLASALTQAGLPPGVLTVLIGPASLGEGITAHPAVDAVTFTGSTGVGRRIAAAAALRGVPSQCEMGGKNAAVVLDDADLELAVEQVTLGAFRSSGQKCTATSRLIVTDGVAQWFLDRLIERVEGMTVDDPTLDTTVMGPVISDCSRRSITAGVTTATAQGASVLTGTPYSDELRAHGYFVAPTVLEVVDSSADVWTDELFGPVLTVRRAADAEHAFELAGDSEFGLSAAVFTQDLTRALHAIDHLDVGVLHINSESAGADPHVPFGGVKKSGLGPKEQGSAARDFFTHTTTVYLRGGESRT